MLPFFWMVQSKQMRQERHEYLLDVYGYQDKKVHAKSG